MSVMISIGNKSESSNNNTSPKTGLFRATVAAINPTQSEIEELLGKNVQWQPEYTGTTTEGEQKINMDFWLEEVSKGEFFRLRFSIVEKIRTSSKNIHNIQWVNTAGQMIYGLSKEDIQTREGWRYEEFRQRPYRRAMIGEENLFDFLSVWILQGKKPNPDQEIDPIMSRFFKGDFRELQELVPIMKQLPGHSAVIALATVAEGKERVYQNIWKSVMPGWVYGRIKEGDKAGMIGKWLDEIEGPYGCRDRFNTAEFLSG